jgi:hypothetical protein
MPTLRDLYACLKTLCDDLNHLREMPTLFNVELWHPAHQVREECRISVEACIRTFEGLVHQFPDEWVSGDSQKSKYIVLKRSLDKLLGSVQKLPYSDAPFNCPSPAAVNEDAKREIFKLRDALKDWLDLQREKGLEEPAALGSWVTMFRGLLQKSSKALRQYAKLRSEIFGELVAIQALSGAPWRIQLTREWAPGDPTLPAKFSFQWTDDLRHRKRKKQVVKEIDRTNLSNFLGDLFKPLDRPVKGFELLNGNDCGPGPGTEAAAAKSRMLVLLNATLCEVKTLAASLPSIQHEAKELRLKTDTGSLARLVRKLPVFPYWPLSAKEMTQADFDKEKPLLEHARLTLGSLENDARRLAEAVKRPTRAAVLEGVDHLRPSNGPPFNAANPGVDDGANLDEASPKQVQALPASAQSTKPATPTKKELNEKDREAANFIRQNPGSKGEVVARAISVSPEHFRSRIVPKLKQHGFYNNKDGYRPPQP